MPSPGLQTSWTVSCSFGPTLDPTPVSDPRHHLCLASRDFSRPHMACISEPPCAPPALWATPPIQLSACSAPPQPHRGQSQMLLSNKCQNNSLHMKSTHPHCVGHMSRVSGKRTPKQLSWRDKMRKLQKKKKNGEGSEPHGSGCQGHAMLIAVSTPKSMAS